MKNLTGKKLIAALQGKRAAVLGLGRSGISAARALKKIGAQVFLSESRKKSVAAPALPKDLKSLPSEFGGHSSKILDQDLLVISPGIHLDLPLILRAKNKGILILNELELGWRLGEFKNVAAVTGTNGKTTTVSLLSHMCREGGFKTLTAGNIGRPLCDYFEKAKDFERIILEVSSYQLESCSLFRPDIACVLNLTPDHLERHGTMMAYARAKERVFMNQRPRDRAIFNWDNSYCRRMAGRVRAQKIYFSVNSSLKKGVCLDAPRSNLRVRLSYKGVLPLPRHLPGLHNIENSCAASAAALSLGISPKAIARALNSFKGVPHRLETVRTRKGVVYINDSKGTNVDSTQKALEAVSAPLWIILGGEDKGAPYEPLKALIRQKARGIFLIGEASAKIQKALRGSTAIYSCGTLKKAVREASRRAQAGDAVLLSPACASFDQFKNYEDRGDQFKSCVRELKA